LGERFERGDGFDQARDGEGVADAAGFTNEMQHSAFAGERNRNAHQRGDAGAIDLRDAVQVNDHFAAGFVEDGLQRRCELIAGFADGEAAMDVKNVDAIFVAYVDFDWGVLGHGDNFGAGFVETNCDYRKVCETEPETLDAVCRNTALYA